MPPAGLDMKKLDNFPGDLAAHWRAPLVCIPDGVQQLFRGLLFDEVSDRPRLQRVENLFGIFIHREHYDAQRWGQCMQFLDAFDAIHTWQVYVHEENIRQQPRNLLQGNLSIGVAGKTAHSLSPVEVADKSFTNTNIVFDNRNCDGRDFAFTAENAFGASMAESIFDILGASPDTLFFQTQTSITGL